MTNETTLAVLRRFNDAAARQDIDEMMATMTDDCLFDNTSHAPDGEAFRGQSAVRGFWESFFRSWPAARVSRRKRSSRPATEPSSCGATTGSPTTARRGHLRGVDVFRIHEGKIAEKRSYVKG